MDSNSDQRTRLHQLIDLACIHRRWTKVELARALKRDPTKLYPESGNPKMDFLVALADTLAWSIDDVVDYVQRGLPAGGSRPGSDDYEALDRAAREAHARGDYAELIEIARKLYRIASTPEQRARACNREHGGWDGLGRHVKALEAACRGLREDNISSRRRLQLQANLANTHYALWELSSAHAHAHVVIEWYTSHPPLETIDRKNEAFAYYVRGHTFRRMAAREAEQRLLHCQRAKDDLSRSAAMYTALAAELSDDRLAGVANTCKSGVVEVSVTLNLMGAREAVELLWSSIDALADNESAPVGDWLESHGWTCIFGANVALRYLSGREQDQALGKFTNKALEIAERLDNWALRERVFEIDFQLHKVQCETTDLDLPYTIDQEDMRLIVGTMGRFPMFHQTGWEILRTAKIVADLQRN